LTFLRAHIRRATPPLLLRVLFFALAVFAILIVSWTDTLSTTFRFQQAGSLPSAADTTFGSDSTFRIPIPPWADTSAFFQQQQQQYGSADRASRQTFDSLHLIDSLGRSAYDSLYRSGKFGSQPELSDSTDALYHYTPYLDSTARVAQFVYRRTDSPVAELFPRTPHSLYARNQSVVYRREVQFDSTGQFIVAREIVNGADAKIPVRVTVDEYVHLRMAEERRNSWKAMAREYRFREGRDDLEGLMGSLTNIEIPVPANPLLSIFGRNTINLKISGGVDIRGAFRSTKSDQVTISSLDQVRNEPDFNQDVRINVNGLIGDKLNINADWNTQRTFEYENSLKIKYTGYDDEIVQSVEAGNVSLQTPSLAGGGQALFGIKAKLQTGPLTLTTLLSQKKGQTKELSLSGGSRQDTIDIYPYAYSRNYYFVDTLYRKYWEQLHRQAIPEIPSELRQHQIIGMDVWMSIDRPQNNQTARLANAYIDLPSRTANEPPPIMGQREEGRGDFETGYFIKLDPTKDYKFVQNQQYGGYIVLNTSVNNDQALAVTYVTVGPDQQGGTADDRIFGALSESDTSANGRLLLKLVKPRNSWTQPSWKPAWDLMLKNVYAIGGRDVKRDGFKLWVQRRTTGNSEDNVLGVNLLSVLGLDRFDDNYSPGANNEFDFLPGLTIDVERAEIIFPTLRPFDQGIIEYFQRQNPPVAVPPEFLSSEVYDTTVTAAQTSPNNIYTIRVKSQTAQSGRYNLGFNIVEGSVQVLMNGTPLTPNIDYTVDYIIGEVVVRNPQALSPGANIQVKYEQNDLFQLASKTLIGARGELSMFPNVNLGFTVMNLNQATLSDKVRLNEEPTSNMILGADASGTFDLPFLTSALDALPMLKTRAMSTLQFSGEGAYIRPDPNTKKSPIASDKGASIAYLDDFEGARRTIPFPIHYSAWTLASVPVHSLLGDNLTEEEKTYSKAKLAWYNNSSNFEGVTVSQIWPNRSVRRGQELQTVLYLDYNPNRRGMYNYSPHLDSTLHRSPINGVGGNFDNASERRKNWAGVMRSLSTLAGNVMEQNMAYLEIWLQANSDDIDDLRRGKLYVNLGRISEDVIPNGQLNSEDVVVNPIPNGILNPGEDVGLDMLSDGQEQTDPRIRAFLDSPGNAGDPDVDPNDPSGDNWSFVVDGRDFTRINGTERNEAAPSGRIPDTEDLNNDGTVNIANTYIEYEVPLDTLYYQHPEDVTLVENPLRVGGGSNGWYQIRIPLTDSTRIIPSGQSVQSILSNVQYVRLWMSGFSKPVKVRIAEMNLVGNQWQERVPSDSTMKAAVVNTEDTPGYTSPPGVQGDLDRTDPNQPIRGNEQSLALIIHGLADGDTRRVFKSYAVRPLDLFNYRSMKFFVHGDPNFNYISPENYDAEVFIRFGSDSLNFYEYRQPVRSGWENDISILFSELTSIKAQRDSINSITHFPAPNGPPGSRYGVRGNPSLRQVREIELGVTNPAGIGTISPLHGEIWVNELRLVDVDNSPGLAYRFDTQLKLADFGTLAFNYSKTDPNFHPIDQRFGSQNTVQSWAFNASAALDRFFPSDWQGTSIPVGYSHQEYFTNPRYLPNSDVVVTEAAARAAEAAAANGQDPAAASGAVITQSQSRRVQDSYSVSNFRIVPPIDAWYIRDTFSKLSMSFNYSTATDRDPSIFYRRGWMWNTRVNYAVTLPTDYFVQPFKSLFSGVFLLDDFKDWKFYFVPITNLSGSAGGQRSRTLEIPRAVGSLLRDTRNFTAGKTVGFGWKFTEGGLTNLSGDYGLTIDRNLLFLDNDTSGRDFGSILKNVFFGGRDGRYSQRVSANSKPRIPNIFNIQKFLDLTANYSVQYNWQNLFQQTDIGKSAGWDNNMTFSMNFRLKALTDPWFAESSTAPKAPRPRRAVTQEVDSTGAPKDQTSPKDQAETEDDDSPGALDRLRSLARIFLKVPFLDYETINITFTQTNRVANSGVIGSSGFMNFWGRWPFQGSRLMYGPSRLYQLGLITDPSGYLQYTPKSSFPFVGWKTVHGLRAPNAQLSDQFAQANNIALRTSRPLWTGATLDINWKVGWQYSRNTTLNTDEFGNPTTGTVVTAGSVERSFLTLPPVFFLKSLNSGLSDVGKKYEVLKTSMPQNAALAEAFERGMEALPFLNRVFGQFVPRANWTFRWDGLERLAGLSSVVQRMSLEHTYVGSFRRDFRSLPAGGQQTDIERASYGFAPLAGVTATFSDFMKGNLQGTLRYNTTTSFDLNLSALNIVETLSQEMSVSLTYSRRGFQFPLFGVNLSNDVDMSMTYSRTKNSRRTHDPKLLVVKADGTPLDGSTRTQLEPRIRYVLSTRVTAALFYRYSKIAPDEGGSLIFGSTTNEAGVDIHISI
jgi:cell surface protein SprA